MAAAFDREVIERLGKLEFELGQAQEEIGELKAENVEIKKTLSHYDKIALKYGSACMGAIIFGAVVSSHFDKFKEKLIEWFLQ